jgi:predicted O-methyltransferase YrrM
LNFFLLKQWLGYWLKQTDEHSLHSPFFFDLYTKIIKGHHDNSRFQEVKRLYNQYLQDKTALTITDLGAGSKVNSSNKRTIASIARNSTTPARFSALLCRLIEYMEYKTVLELGTSLGVNTLYMEKAKTQPEIVSFEGGPEIIKIASRQLNKSKQIRLIEGNIDTTLPAFLSSISSKKLDMVYMDANHTYDASLRYFNQIVPKLHTNSLVIMDDIHWSEGMNKAWQEVKKHPAVCSTIDLFEAGLIFFNPDLSKEHFILQF